MVYVQRWQTINTNRWPRRYDVPLSDAKVEIHSNFLFVRSDKVKDRERERLFFSASRLNKTVGSSLCHPKPTPFITRYNFFFLFCSFHLMSSLWEPTAPWKSFSKQRICWKGPIGGEICLWHRAGHGGRVWCINNQSSRRGEGAQPTLFSTHQRSLSDWGHCKTAPLLLLQPHIVMPRRTYTVPFSRFFMSEMSWRGEEREPQQTWWHLIWVYFTTRLSLVKLFVLLNQTFLLYGHAELKNVFNLTLSAKLDHLGPVFVSMAVLLLSSRVC